MDLKLICNTWDIGRIIEIREINQGFMNKTYSIITEDNSYILRIYESESDITKVRREYLILEYLSNCQLSFEVPTFIMNHTGDYLYQSSENGTISILMPLLKGINPDLSDAKQAYEAGKALGELNKALSRLSEDVYKDLGRNPAYDQFRQFHPLIKGIDKIVDHLPTSIAKKHELHKIFQQLDKEIDNSYYHLLGKQYIHGDYTSGNILSIKGKITGIIDFEFCCYDVRPMDLAIALGGGPTALWEMDQSLTNIGMLTKGYVSVTPLTENELLYIPFLIRLRRAAMFVYFTARYVKGLDSENWIIGIIDWILASEAWLIDNKDRLIDKIIQQSR
ncbi:phosphotransferase enzyme family protein [Bacillus massilinigeriensis]|uniref:phosphotransferase enzyme family protein n=1 Tax=Bacillus massilionigeriensis TaxID=1805475 RepID=UPI00096B5DC3|nr:phosphotransferase [Bacillus massilionigeriensis]